MRARKNKKEKKNKNMFWCKYDGYEDEGKWSEKNRNACMDQQREKRKKKERERKASNAK